MLIIEIAQYIQDSIHEFLNERDKHKYPIMRRET